MGVKNSWNVSVLDFCRNMWNISGRLDYGTLDIFRCFDIYFISFLRRSPSRILDIQSGRRRTKPREILPLRIQISQIDHWHGVDTLTGLKCRSNRFKTRLGRLLQVMKNGTENGKKSPLSTSTRSALLNFLPITQCQLPSFILFKPTRVTWWFDHKQVTKSTSISTFLLNPSTIKSEFL